MRAPRVGLLLCRGLLRASCLRPSSHRRMLRSSTALNANKDHDGPPIVEHDLCAFLRRGERRPEQEDHNNEEPHHVLVVVNSGSFGHELLRALWTCSVVRVCADGGANRVFDLTGGTLVPDAVVGDFDSAREDVRAFFEERGAQVTQVVDQDRTDLDKALEAARSLLRHRLGGDDDDDNNNPTTFVSVLGAFGGRFDHVMAALDAAYRWSDAWPRAHFRLYADDTLGLVLAPGIEHRIRVRPRVEGPHCGLVPVGRRVDEVTTAGFRWNLDGDPLEFGHLVSTSNLFDVEDASSPPSPSSEAPASAAADAPSRNGADDYQTHLLRVRTSHPLLYTAALQTPALTAAILRATAEGEGVGGQAP